MGNRPYEKDNNILSTFMATGIMSGVAYTGYKAYKGETEGFTNAWNKAKDFFVETTPNQASLMQDQINAANQAISSVTPFAKKRRDATYANREAESLAKRQAILDAGGEFASLANTKINTIPINGVKGDLLGFSHTDQIVDGFGQKVWDKFVINVESITGIKPIHVGFSGTEQIVEFGGMQVKIPWTQKDKNTGAWMARDGATHRVAGSPYAPTVHNGRLAGIDVVDPNTKILEGFSSDLAYLYGANADDHHIAKDILKKRRGASSEELSEQVMKRIDSAIASKKATEDIHSSFTFERYMRNIRSGQIYTEANNQAMWSFYGNNMPLDRFKLLELEWADRKYQGIADMSLTLNKVGQFGNEVKDNFMSGSVINEFTELPSLVRANPSLSRRGSAFGYLNVDNTDPLVYTAASLSQGQVAEGTLTTFRPMAHGFGVDTNKSIKGYRFTKRSKMPGENTPLFWNKEIAQTSSIYNDIATHGTYSPLLVMDNSAEETIILSKQAMAKTNVERPFQFKVKGGASFYGSYHNNIADNVPEYTRIMYGYGENQTAEAASFWDLFMSPKYPTQDITHAIIPRGTYIGEVDPSFQISDEHSLSFLDRRNNSLYSKHDFMMNADDIISTRQYIQSNGGMSKGIPFIGRIISPSVKIGGAFEVRNSVHEASSDYMKQIIKMSRLKGKSARRLSGSYDFSFVKKMLPSLLENGSISDPKGRVALLSVLQEMIVGHANVMPHAILDEGFTDIVKSMMVNPDKMQGNSLYETIRKGFLQFDHQALPIEEQLQNSVRLLGAFRGDYELGINASNEWENYKSTKYVNKSGIALNEPLYHVINSNHYPLQKAANILNTDFNNFDSEKMIRPFFISPQLSPQESLYEQGGSGYIHKLSVNDIPYNIDPDVLRDLASSNLVDSQKILAEGQLGLYSLNPANNLSKQYETLGVRQLDQDGLSKMLGGDVGPLRAHELRNPEAFVKTLFNPEVNPTGFTLPNAKGGYTFFESGDFWQGAQYLNEEERLTIESSKRRVYEVLREAYDHSGVVTEEGQKKLAEIRTSGYWSSKSGFKSHGSMHLEGLERGKVLGDPRLLSNAKVLNSVKKFSPELDQFLGFTASIDRNTYKQMLRKEIEEAIILAGGESATVDTLRAALIEKHGGDHFFSGLSDEALANYQTSIDNMENVANKVYNRTSNNIRRLGLRQAGHRPLRLEVAKAIADRNMADIDSVTIGGFLNRSPSIETGNNAAMRVVPGHSSVSRSIIGGRYLNIGANADFDGDSEPFKLLVGNKASEGANRMIRRQQEAVRTKQALASHKTHLSNIFGAKDSKIQLPIIPEGYKALSESILTAESERFKAALLTKGQTGSAHVKTVGVKSALYHDILNNKGLTADEYLDAFHYATSMPVQAIEQPVISSKLTALVHDINHGKVSKIGKMVNSVGKVTPESTLKLLGELGGDIGTMPLFQILGGIKSKTGWLNGETGDNINTILNMHHGWRRPVQAKAEAAIKAIGVTTHDDQAKAIAERYFKGIDDAGDIFITETEWAKKLGWDQYENYTDFLNAKSNEKLFPGSDNVVTLQNRAFALRDKLKGGAGEITYEEALAQIAGEANLAQELGLGAMAHPSAQAERIIAGETTNLKFINKLSNMVGEITPGKLLGAGAIALAGFTGLNLLSGDGTPRDINDYPSVNNPSFSNPRIQYSQASSMNMPINANVSGNLITDNRLSFDDSIQHQSAMSYGNRMNTVSVRHDGIDPYKSTYSQYNN